MNLILAFGNLKADLRRPVSPVERMVARFEFERFKFQVFDRKTKRAVSSWLCASDAAAKFLPSRELPVCRSALTDRNQSWRTGVI